MISYHSGHYSKKNSFVSLNVLLSELEQKKNNTLTKKPTQFHRLFYLAVPPREFLNVAENINATSISQVIFFFFFLKKD